MYKLYSSQIGEKMLNPPLKPLEIKILNQLAQGYTQLKIAKDLNMTYNQCIGITKNLRKKFKAENTTVCVVRAYNQGFIK